MNNLDVRTLQNFVWFVRRTLVLMFSATETSEVSARGLGLSGKRWGQMIHFQKMMTLKTVRTAEIADWHLA